jgi:hypothetical protein
VLVPINTAPVTATGVSTNRRRKEFDMKTVISGSKR